MSYSRLTDKRTRTKQRLLTHMAAAKVYAELSYAKRLKVGAVLIKDDRIISVGYNGTPSGMSNKCEYIDSVLDAEVKTKPEVVHAETNVIAFAAKNGVATKDCIMVITHSPCFECSKLIIQAGIRGVYYETEYRLTSGLDFLKKAKLTVEKLS